MAQFFSIHPTHPQKRLIRQAADIVRGGGLIAYPTDSCYALGCDRGSARALERLRRIRGVDQRHRLTLMCRDLGEMARYAIVDDAQFTLLKSVTPGSYTFILRARRELPRRLARKKTIGVRIPGHPVAHALLAELDLVIDGGSCGVEPSTVIDLTAAAPRVLREGKGSLAPFAVERV